MYVVQTHRLRQWHSIKCNELPLDVYHHGCIKERSHQSGNQDFDIFFAPLFTALAWVFNQPEANGGNFLDSNQQEIVNNNIYLFS